MEISHSHQQGRSFILENRKNFFHLHLISDSTGETLIAAGRAAASQFGDSHAVEHVYPLVRNRRQVADVLAAIDGAPGIVLHTVIDQELAAVIDEACNAMGVPCVSVIEPVLQIFQSYLGAPSRRRVGAQHELNAGYFARIEALNFTMDHDDGQLPHNIDEADVILLGISRTSKTPTASGWPPPPLAPSCRSTTGSLQNTAVRPPFATAWLHSSGRPKSPKSSASTPRASG